MPEINPYTPPADDSQPPSPLSPRPEPDTITRGARIAGGCLVANAALVFVEQVVVSGHGRGALTIAPLIDVFIGLSLLGGNGKWRIWALVRCVLGAVVFGGLRIGAFDYVAAGLQLAVSGSIVSLLVGDPGTPRITVSTIAFALYLVVGVAAFFFA